MQNSTLGAKLLKSSLSMLIAVKKIVSACVVKNHILIGTTSNLLQK